MKKGIMWFLLHILIVIFSLSSVCSKLASQSSFLSPRWFMYYGLVLLILMFYALAWQQIIKRMPLSTAYANKAATVVWGQVWGLVIFHEGITAGKLIGAILIVIGIIMHAMASADEDRQERNAKNAQNAGSSGDSLTERPEESMPEESTAEETVPEEAASGEKEGQV